MESETGKNLVIINRSLKDTLGLVKEINRNQPRPRETGIELNLEEELRRRRLTTNERD